MNHSIIKSEITLFFFFKGQCLQRAGNFTLSQLFKNLRKILDNSKKMYKRYILTKLFNMSQSWVFLKLYYAYESFIDLLKCRFWVRSSGWPGILHFYKLLVMPMLLVCGPHFEEQASVYSREWNCWWWVWHMLNTRLMLKYFLKHLYKSDSKKQTKQNKTNKQKIW